MRHRVTPSRLQRMYRTVVASLPDTCDIYGGYIAETGAFSSDALHADVPCHLVSQGAQSELERGEFDPQWIVKSTWRIHLPKYIRIQEGDAIDCQGMVFLVDNPRETHTFQITNSHQLRYGGTLGSQTAPGMPYDYIGDHLLREIVANGEYLIL